MSSTLKLHLETASIVFVSSFLVAIGTATQGLSISSGITQSAIFAIITSAFGVALRALYTSLIPSSLGASLKK